MPRFLLLILTLFFLQSSSSLFALQSSSRPNVILFVTDDQSPVAGCYGNDIIKTPHLDALAADGVRFTHAFATTASCSASRSVILTGLHNHFNGQYGHTHAFHKFDSFRSMRAFALPPLMTQAGYRTAQIAKLHVAPQSVFEFQQYLNANSRNARAMADACQPLIAEKSDQPFFLYFCPSDPHRGGGTDQSFPGKHKPDLFGNLPNKQSHKGVTEVFYDPADVIVPPFLPDTPESRAEIAQYYQSCSRIDDGLGRLIEILKAAGQYENTVIIFTADHGMAFPGAKTTIYEAGLRVPFIVRDPRAPKRGLVNKALISHADITPTILDLAGAYDPKKNKPTKPLSFEKGGVGENDGKPPKRYHGRSWLSILHQTNPDGWDQIIGSHTFHEIQMYYPMRAIRDRQYKFIWNIAHHQPYPFASDLWIAATWQAQWEKGPQAPYGSRTVDSYIHRPQFELYDISSDPHETRNLATLPQHTALLKTYQDKLKAAQKQTNDPWILKWKYE
ncbi:MAG: sulfatase family protein [Verrucomicrobiaceae bacterium]